MYYYPSLEEERRHYYYVLQIRLLPLTKDNIGSSSDAVRSSRRSSRSCRRRRVPPFPRPSLSPPAPQATPPDQAVLSLRIARHPTLPLGDISFGTVLTCVS